MLASILATAAGTATITRGALLLFVYSLGLAVPFLVLAGWLARGQGRYTWPRRIEVDGGGVLIVMGLAVMTGAWTRPMSWMLSNYARLGWPPI